MKQRVEESAQYPKQHSFTLWIAIVAKEGFEKLLSIEKWHDDCRSDHEV